MDYIVEGSTITNRLLFLDGRVQTDIMGGGGFYAFSAVRMCTDNCLFVSSVGKDHDIVYGNWFSKNHCSKDGLFYQLDRTMYNELKYFPDGSYIEYSIYGKQYTSEELTKMRESGLVFLGETDPVELKKQTVDLAKVVPFMDDAKGIYSSTNLNERTTKLFMDHKKNGCKLMWEIPATGVEPAHQAYIKGGIEGLKKHFLAVDILSINRNECSIIFEVNNDKEIIALLKQLQIPVYYRVGIDGAYMIIDNKEYYVPMISTVEKEKEIDPTGCGNTSTGAAMWALIEGYDPLMACVIGNVVASYNVRQYGPYLDMSEKTKEEMLAKSKEIYDKIKGGNYE